MKEEAINLAGVISLFFFLCYYRDFFLSYLSWLCRKLCMNFSWHTIFPKKKKKNSIYQKCIHFSGVGECPEKETTSYLKLLSS